MLAFVHGSLWSVSSHLSVIFLLSSCARHIGHFPLAWPIFHPDCHCSLCYLGFPRGTLLCLSVFFSRASFVLAVQLLNRNILHLLMV